MSVSLALLIALSPTVAGSPAKPAALSPVVKVPAGQVSLANPASLVAVLQKEGYRAKLVTGEGNPFIESAAAGANFTISFENCTDNRDCQDMMFQASYTRREKDPISVETINTFNRDNRWGRGYLDKQGDPRLEFDVLFTDRALSEKSFSEALSIWSSLMGTFQKSLGW